jgi:hypothetical protein
MNRCITATDNAAQQVGVSNTQDGDHGRQGNHHARVREHRKFTDAVVQIKDIEAEVSNTVCAIPVQRLTHYYRWPRPKRTRPHPFIWVRPLCAIQDDFGAYIGTGQLKAKLAKLKRELLTPSGGGGGGGGELSFQVGQLCR